MNLFFSLFFFGAFFWQILAKISCHYEQISSGRRRWRVGFSGGFCVWKKFHFRVLIFGGEFLFCWGCFVSFCHSLRFWGVFVLSVMVFVGVGCFCLYRAFWVFGCCIFKFFSEQTSKVLGSCD
jgi:hypothetical protein